MLSAQGCRGRRQRLWDQLDSNVEWVLITDPKHLMYLANYYQSPFVHRSSDASAVLILGRGGPVILIADNLVRTFADKAHVTEIVAPMWYRNRETPSHRESALICYALERLTRCPGTTFGIEVSHLPVGLLEQLRSQRPALKTVDVEPILRKLRRNKDPDEIALLKRSAEAAQAAHQAAMAGIRPGMTELQAFHLVERTAMETVGEQVMVYGDFVSGPNTLRGGAPSQRVINKGELFLLDLSVVLYGYRTDMANTFIVRGKPTDQQRRMFEACMEAMEAGEALLRPGYSCQLIDKALRDTFDQSQLATAFPLDAGHGIGLSHPEAPFFVPESNDILYAGDAVTLEPGLYIPGVGGMRFERNYFITHNGAELLTHHSLTLEPTAVAKPRPATVPKAVPAIDRVVG